ncbi:MAG: DUF2892 domain-containing protein [Bacteroidota bacterium]
MAKNIGRTDRSFRFLMGHILLLTGLWMFNGLNGNITGILITIFALFPFYMAITGKCILFYLLKIHSLSQTELKVYGHPYAKD